MNGSYYFINSTSLKYMLTNVHTHVTRTTVMVWDISVHCKKPAVTVHTHPPTPAPGGYDGRSVPWIRLDLLELPINGITRYAVFDVLFCCVFLRFTHTAAHTTGVFFLIIKCCSFARMNCSCPRTFGFFPVWDCYK